jgi:KaiC/GvpD/RAD55 family RecA-like ATPase
MYYKGRRETKDNTLIKSLLDLVENYNYNDLTEPRFMLTLQQDGRTVEEATMIYKKIYQCQSYDRSQAGVFIENLKKICYSAYVSKIHDLYQNDPVTYVSKLKEFDYRSNYSDTLIAKTFSQLDITDLVNRYSAEGYRSRYEFINQSYNCGGYIPAQLVLVCGAPGVGKSLFLQSEAVNFIQQGKRVHYLVMGDLNELDLAIRMMCQLSNKPQAAIESDILGNFDLYKEKFSEYLSMTIVPSGVVSSREYVDWMKQRVNEYDVLMIDYYSNFKQNEDRSMYLNGGDICDSLTELTREGKLVFMAVQPKQAYFGEEFLPYEALGESSRLVHVADMIVTIGRRWEAGMRMGRMNIAKNRRGKPDAVTEANWIGTNEGLFYICSDALYARYRSDSRHRKLYSYNELRTQDILDEGINSIMSPTLAKEEEDK